MAKKGLDSLVLRHSGALEDEVCVTGREDSGTHCTLVLGELPGAGVSHSQPHYRIPVRRGWGLGQLGNVT